MIVELKPEQELVLDRAVQAGMSQEEVLEQAFAIISSQLDSADWMMEDRERINALIEERMAQAERGELIDGDRAIEILRERHAKRQIA
jgi:hypothetical protein